MGFWKFNWLRNLVRGKAVKSPISRNRIEPLLIEALEHRITPAGGNLLYQATHAATVTLRLANDQVQIVDNLHQVIAAMDRADTSHVYIAGNGHDLTLIIDASAPLLPGGIVFDGGAGVNTLIGPDGIDTEWHITGPDNGDLGRPGFVSFYGVENLTGGIDNDDTFIVVGGGGLSGLVEGGDGGFDTVRLTGHYQNVGYEVTNFDSGIITLDALSVRFDGMEPVQFTQVANTFTYNGTVGDDTIVLSDIPDSGLLRMQISGTGELVQFANPTVALIINGKQGSDTITVNSIDPDFAAELKIYGNHGNAPQVIEDGGVDTVTFAGNVDTHGGYLEAFADHIIVNDHVTLSTQTTDPNGESSDIVFRARRFNVPEIQNLSPLIVQTKTTSVVIGEGAILQAASIYIYSQSEDRSLAQILGIDRRVNNLIIEPLTSKVTDLLALPVKVLVKGAEASITLKNGSQMLAEGLVGLYSSAGTTAGGVAKSVLASIGFAQAKSTSTVTIGANVVIDSGDAVVITSAANAEANMSTETSRDLGDVPGGNSTQIAVSLAITNAEVTSHITVDATATITAAKTANIRATGDVTSEAESKAGVFSDGTAALSFGIELSKADIQTTVNGTVTANMDTSESDVAGATVVMAPLVKLEFDPTETDPTKPGYIDFVNNTINVGHTTLVTEDTVTYQNRRGNSIGNLVDGQEYVVISVEDDPNTPFNESWLIKLALTEQKSIDGEAIDLTPGFPNVAVNTKTFDGDDVDGALNTITLANPAFTGAGTLDFSLLGSTFELGQAIVYHEGTSPIPGLVDGAGYYIITGTNEFNLQGNNRFVEKQVIQLAETENEARAGVAIDIGAAPGGATGFSFTAKHVLDSDWATGLGVLAELKAENKASAEAGVNEGDTEDPSTFDQAFGLLDKSLFDRIFQGLTKEYRDNASKGNSGATNSLNVAGALAFSFADHTVLANVGSTAVLKSNEDLEVKALITEKFQASAESSTEPQPDPNNPGGSTSAENTVSVAIVVGIYNNTAKATVASDAELDALKALRVISNVTLPYVNRPDEFVPSTMGELIDMLQNDGYDTVNNYMDGTLGLKSKLFHTWARSTAKADELAIAGSVNVLVINNTSEATVKSGAKLNQDEDWRDQSIPIADQHINNTGEQVVSVEATTFMQTLNVTGVFNFKFPSASITPGGLDFDKKIDLNPAGSSSKRGGFGGAIFIEVMGNHTKALIEDGVEIYSGPDGGFNLKAEEAILNFAFSQAGASAGQYAIAGTFTYVQQTGDTLAHLAAGAVVTGRNARVYAGSLDTIINWAGAVAKGEAVGIGLSVAINNINRTTRAIIGDIAAAGDPNPATNSLTPTSIDVTGDVSVLAKTDGALWAFTIAGTLVKEEPTPPQDDDPLDGASLPILFGDAPAEPPKAKTGLGIAGAVSVNLITDNTLAYINNAEIDTSRSVDGAPGEFSVPLATGAVNVTATNKTNVVAATGGAALVINTGSSNSTAIGGAFSFNDLKSFTRAFILKARIETTADAPGEPLPDLIVSATRTGNLVAIAAGAAGNTSSNGTAAAGSVSYNNIENTAEAYLDDVEVVVTGSLTVSASDDANMVAVGGGVGIGRESGFGASLGYNHIGGATVARIDNSDLDLGGDLTISAVGDNSLTAVAISAGVGKQTGAAFTISINRLTKTITAELLDSDLTRAGDIDISAEDDSTFVSIAGAVGVGLQGTGFGFAFGYNEIDSDIRAAIEDSEIAGVTGSVTITATSDQDLVGVSVGVGGSSSGSAIAGSVAVNIIVTTVDAHIESSDIHAAGGVVLTARDESLVVAVAGGLAVSLSGGAGIGASISYNRISNGVAAYIDDSDVQSDSSHVLLSAVSTPLLIAIGAAGGGSSSIGGAGTLTLNSIANTIDAHITRSDIQAFGDVSLTASEAASMVVIALAGAGAPSGGAIGASIAYNYIGGLEPTDPNVLSYADGIVDGAKDVTVAGSEGAPSSSVQAFIDGSNVQAGGRVLVLAGFDDPTKQADPGPLAAEVKALNPAGQVNVTTSTINFTSPHGYKTGDEVVYFKGVLANGAVGGLIDGTAYYVIKVDDDSIKLAATQADALEQISINLTALGTGSGHSIRALDPARRQVFNPKPANTSNSQIKFTNDDNLDFDHGFANLEPVVYHKGAIGNIRIGGLTDGAVYYVIRVSRTRIRLAATLALATAGIGISLPTAGTGEGHSFTPLAAAKTFNPAVAVTVFNANQDLITFTAPHGLNTGDAVFYRNGGGTSVGGLRNNETYYVIRVDATHIRLAATLKDATQKNSANVPIPKHVFLSALGTGTDHSLIVKPRSVMAGTVAIPFPVGIGAQITSVTAAGAGGQGVGGAGAVSINFVRMDVLARISNVTGPNQISAGGDILVQAADTSHINSGTGSLGIATSSGVAVNASVGVNDIRNNVEATIVGAKVQSTAGDVVVSADERARIINVVIGGAVAAGGGAAFGGSFAINFIKSTIDAGIRGNSASGASDVDAHGDISVRARDEASIATLAGNISISIGAGGAVGVAFAVNEVNDSVTAAIDGSTAAAATGEITVDATFAKPDDLPTGLDVQIAAMAVAGGGASDIAGAGSVALNWVRNTVEAKIANIGNVGAGDEISAAGKLTVTASDNSTINSLAGAIAIAGIGASAASAAIGASVAYNYLGGDPNDPSSTNNNVVRAAIENVAGSVRAHQIDVHATYEGHINNITIAGAGAGTFALGGAVSINFIRNKTDAHISGASDVVTTKAGADSLRIKAEDTSAIWVLAGGVGIAIATTVPVGLAAGVSVAINEITDNITAYVDNSKVTAGGNVEVKAEATSDIQAITIGVAIGVVAGTDGFAGSGAGAGSGNTIRNTIHAYIANSQSASNKGVFAGGSLTVSAVDDPSIIAGAGALAVAVAVGANGGAGVSIGASVTDNDIENSVKAYVSNATAQATSANLDVTATETATIDAYSVAGSVAVAGGTFVGAAGAGAGGSATNTVKNTVEAYVDSGSLTTLTSGDVRLIATDSADTYALNVAGAVSIAASAIGSAAIAIGASIADNTIENTVRAYSQSSTISSAHSIFIEAGSTATIHAVSVAVSVSVAVAIGSLALSGAGANSTNKVNNTIAAFIQGPSAASRSTTTAANNITVTATENATIDSKVVAFAGSGGVAGGSVGVSLASNTVTSNIKAFAQNANLTATGGFISLGATATDTVTSLSVATSISISIGGAGAGADAVSKVNPAVEAYTGNATTLNAGGNVSIIAGTTNSSQAETYGAAGGLVAIGASTTNVEANGSVKAHADGVIAGANNVTVQATATNTSDAKATGLAGGAIAASGAGANATTSPTVEAYTSGNVTAQQAVLVAARVTPKATARAIGVAVGAAAGVGGSEANSYVAPTVSAHVGGNGVTINAASLTVMASQLLPGGGVSSNAEAYGASGGIFLAVNASVSRATNGNSSKQASYTSYVADNTTLNITNATAITVNNHSKQNSVADNFNLGALAVGAGHADARSNTLSEAYLGMGVTLTGSSLLVSATGNDNNFAKTIAGAAGAVSGAGSKGTTDTTATTTAKIKNSDGVKKIDLTQRGTGTAQLTADHTATVNGQQLTFAGGALAGTGAEVTNDINSTVEAGVGTFVTLWAKSIDIGAVNHLSKPALADYQNALDPDKTGPNILGATGGAVSAAGATSITKITFNTRVLVGTNSKLEVKGTPTSASKIYLHALNDFNATDKVTLATGGALSGAGGRTEIKTLTDLAKVDIGTGALLKSVGQVEISARGQGTIFAAIATDTFGVGTVAFSYSVAEIKPTNTVVIGTNAMIQAQGDLDISAGSDTKFNRDQYKITARTDTFAGSLIPIYDVDATANLIQDNKITISAGAVLETARNASLHAERLGYADMTAYAKATTWISAIDDAITGKTFNKGNVKTEAHGTIENNGTIRTGLNREKFLTLDSWDSHPVSGPPTVSASVQSDGITFTVTQEKLESTLVQELKNAKNQLAIFQSSGNATLITFYSNEVNRLQAELDALGLLDQPVSGSMQPGTPPPNVKEQFVFTVNIDDIWAQAGIIDIRADVIQGSAGLFDSPGDAKVIIHNSTPAFLNIHRITIPETNGGLFFNGVAADNAKINELNTPDAGVTLGPVSFQPIALPGVGIPPVIEIKNTFNPLTYSDPAHPGDTYPPPNITILGNLDAAGILRGIDNLNGNVSLLIQGGKGSIYIQAPVRAKNLSVATGGDVFINGITQYAVGGEALSQWRSVTNSTQASHPRGADNVYGTGDEGNVGAVSGVVNQPLGALSTIQIASVDRGVQPANNVVNKFDNTFSGTNRIYNVTLTAGKQYFINMKQLGVDNPLDPFLTLQNASGGFIASDNNSGGGQDGQDARITFTPSTTGTYRIVAGGAGSGQFTVEVSTGIHFANSIALPYATGGTFNLTFDNRTCSNIPYNVSASGLQLRLNSAGMGHVFSVTGSGSVGDPFIVTVTDTFNDFANNFAADITNLIGAVSLYGDRIFITANYLNVNGIMQSGKADYNLTIGQATIDEITAIKNAGLTGLVVLNSVTNNDFVVRFDTFYNRIQVEEVLVSGGYIEIHGHVLNTGAGEIRLLGGYGNINIDNSTTYDLVIERLDASKRGAGKLILQDTSYGPNYATLYEKAGGTVTKTVDTGSGTPTVTGNVGDTPTYQPLSGYRYGWSVSQAQYERTNTLYGTSAWLDFDALAADPDNIVSTTTEKVGQPVIAGEGPYYYIEGNAALAAKDYSYSYTNTNQGAPTTYTTERYTESTWYGKKTYYTRTVTEQKQEELHTHTIRADRPIGIRFLGANEGNITVTSAAGILIDGPIQNPSGTTSLTAATGITQLRDLGYVNGRRVDLAAGTGIGSDIVAVNTQVADGAPHDFDTTKLLIALVTGDKVKQVSSGNVYRYLASPASLDLGAENYGNGSRWALDSGDFKYTTDASRSRVVPGNQVLVNAGHTQGGDAGSVYRYIGSTPTLLDLSVQNFATASWQKVTFFSSFEATSTTGNITIDQFTGDLPIDNIKAGPGGNVTVTAQNSITVAQLSAGTFAPGTIGQGTTANPNGSIVLTATSGDIGDLAHPLTLYSGTQLKDTVSATAQGSIYLKEGIFSAAAKAADPRAGDLRVKKIQSLSANSIVYIEVMDGALIDANNDQIVDQRTKDELANGLWHDLQLTDVLTPLVNGDNVQLANGYPNGGVAGSIYRYLGAAQSLNLGTQDYTNGALWQLVGHNFTTGDGTVNLAANDRVFVQQTYHGGGLQSRVYRYTGTAGSHDLGLEDYTNTAQWELTAPVSVKFTTDAGGATGKRNATIASYKAFKQQEYDTYWNYRTQQARADQIGLADEGIYYVVVDPLDPTRILLARSHADATAAMPILVNLTASPTLGANHRLQFLTPAELNSMPLTGAAPYKTFNSMTGVSSANETILLGAGHGLVTGDAVQYTREFTFTYDGAYHLELAPAEEAFYRTELGYNDAAIVTLENKRTAEYHDLHNRYAAFGTTFNPNFVYVLSAAEETALQGSIKTWTVEELLNLASAGLLKSTAGTQVNIEAPNIMGHDVTIIAAKGIGNTTGKIEIDLVNRPKPLQLTLDERVAFAAADRIDVSYLAGNPVTVFVNLNDNDPALDTITRSTGSWIADGFAVGTTFELAGNSPNATEKGVYYTVTAVTATTLTLSSGDHLFTEAFKTVTLTPIVVDPSTPQSVLSAILFQFDTMAGAANLTTGDTVKVLFGYTLGGKEGSIYRYMGAPGSVPLNQEDYFNTARWQEISAVDFLDNGANPDTIVRNDAGSWVDDGFKAGMKITVAGNSGNATGLGAFYTIQSVTGRVITLIPGDSLTSEAGARVSMLGPKPVITKIVIDQRDDVNINATGKINARGGLLNAGQIFAQPGVNVFLGSGAPLGGTELPLNLNQVLAGDKVRIKSRPGIVNVAAAGVPNIISGDMILESGRDAVGTAAKPILIQPYAGATLTARASKDVYVNQHNATNNAGNMNVETVSSDTGGVYLVADGSILDALNTDTPKIAGLHIELVAGGQIVGGVFQVFDANAQIGAAGNFLETNLAGDPSSSITATAAKDIRLREYSGDMGLDHIFSKEGDVYLRADASILDSASAAFDNSGLPSRPKTDIFGNNITLIADFGAIGISGNDIDVDTRFGGAKNGTLTASSFLGANIIETGGDAMNIAAGEGDLYLFEVSTGVGNTTGTLYTAFIAASRGSIFNGKPNGPNLLSGRAILFARDHIGTEAKHLQTVVGTLQGTSTTGSTWIDNNGGLHLDAVDGVSSTGIQAGGSVYINASSPVTVDKDVISETQEIVIVALDDNADAGLPGVDDDDPDHLIVKAEVTIWSKLSFVKLLAGDDLTIEAGNGMVGPAIVKAATEITLQGDFQGDIIGNDPPPGHVNADPGVGSNIKILGYVEAPEIIVKGEADADVILIDMSAAGSMLLGHARVLGGSGIDIITVTSLNTRQTMAGAIIPQSLDVDGQDGADAVTINFRGGAATNNLINVFDTGTNGDDTLTINGTAQADNILARASKHAFNAANYLAGGVAFVANIHGDPAATIERVNYNKSLVSLVVNAGDGADTVSIDDNWAPMTIRGGAGEDKFQVAQIFKSERDANANVAPFDEMETTLTTRGYLTNGASFETTIEGGDDADTFSVFRNIAQIHLLGQGGDDLFIVRAFALEGSVEENVAGGGGADLITYVLNAPVNVVGGDGTDTLRVIGTEFGDKFVITAAGIIGAGVTVNYVQIERLEVDAAEGNDTFYVLSTDPLVETILYGGLGSDTFIIGGDVPDIFSGAMLLFPATAGNHTMQGIAASLLTLDGASSPGYAPALLDPVMLPGETNALPSQGGVDSYSGTGAASAIDTMQIDGSNLGVVPTNPLVNQILNPLTDLLGANPPATALTLEITAGPGRGRFYLITGVQLVGPNQYRLTLQNVAQPDEDWGVPTAASEFAITHAAHSFFVNEALSKDHAIIFNDKDIARTDGVLRDLDHGLDGLGNITVTSTMLTGLGMGTGIKSTNLENLDILLGKFDDVFTVRGTAKGTRTKVDANDGQDLIQVGSTLAQNNGNLDLIQGRLLVLSQANPSAAQPDRIYINDYAKTGRANYLITPTMVVQYDLPASFVPSPPIANFNPPRPTFAGIDYDGTTEKLQIDGNDDVNIFNVQPSLKTEFFINGNRPQSGVPIPGGGDYLMLDTKTTGTTGRKLFITAVGQGHWGFTSAHKNVGFTGIERFNHVATYAVANAGKTPLVKVYDAETNEFLYQVRPYENSFRGGVRVVTGDVNHDGLPDLIVAPGGGRAATIKVYNGSPNAVAAYPARLLTSFNATFPASFTKGLYLAIGDVNRDGADDLIVSADAGWLPMVEVFDGKKIVGNHGLLVKPFQVFANNYRGGVRVAAGDINRDGYADIIVGSGPGMVATVKVFSWTDLGSVKPAARRTFEPFGKTFKNGVFVAVGDVNGNGVRDISVSADQGWLPMVTTFEGTGFATGAASNVIQRYQPFPNSTRVGVRTVAKPTDGGNPGFVEKTDLFHALGKGGGTNAKKVVVAQFRGIGLIPKIVDRLFEKATYDGIYLG